MDLCVQLKVCEGCGCLWYRTQSQKGVYCLGCDARLKQFPPAQNRRRPGLRTGRTLARIWAVARYSEETLSFSVEPSGGVE